MRFGAYHIYLPHLLKPAPRALAAQLWALKHEGPQTKGLDDVPHLAGSGRTSIPADKEMPKALYRAAGYRVCGERAVRVDILERLADLIRPALAWREGAPATEAAGRGRGRRLHRDGAHDVAHRRVGRGFRLGPALARLPHGEAAEAGRAGSRRRAEAAAPQAAIARPQTRRRPLPKRRRSRCRAERRPTLPKPRLRRRRPKPSRSRAAADSRLRRLRLSCASRSRG